MKCLSEFENEKCKTLHENEQYFLDNIPGDGITLLSVSPLSSSKGEIELQDESNEREEAIRRSLYYLELQKIPSTEVPESKADNGDVRSGKRIFYLQFHIYNILANNNMHY